MDSTAVIQEKNVNAKDHSVKLEMFEGRNGEVMLDDRRKLNMQPSCILIPESARHDGVRLLLPSIEISELRFR